MLAINSYLHSIPHLGSVCEDGLGPCEPAVLATGYNEIPVVGRRMHISLVTGRYASGGLHLKRPFSLVETSRAAG